MDLLFTFIKAIVFEVTLFLFCFVRSVLQNSAWKTIQLKVNRDKNLFFSSFFHLTHQQKPFQRTTIQG